MPLIRKRPPAPDFPVVLLPKTDAQLTVVIGDGKLGEIVLETHDGNFMKGPFTNSILGKAEDLAGKAIRLNAKVMDNPALSAFTTVTVYIDGKLVGQLKEPFEKQGNLLTFLCQVSFLPSAPPATALNPHKTA